METVIHIVIEWKSVYYIAYGLEISLNKTKQHLSHRPIIVMMRLELTGLKIHSGFVWPKRLRFCLGINRF